MAVLSFLRRELWLCYQFLVDRIGGVISLKSTVMVVLSVQSDRNGGVICSKTTVMVVISVLRRQL